MYNISNDIFEHEIKKYLLPTKKSCFRRIIKHLSKIIDTNEITFIPDKYCIIIALNNIEILISPYKFFDENPELPNDCFYINVTCSGKYIVEYYIKYYEYIKPFLYSIPQYFKSLFPQKMIYYEYATHKSALENWALCMGGKI